MWLLTVFMMLITGVAHTPEQDIKIHQIMEDRMAREIIKFTEKENITLYLIEKSVPFSERIQVTDAIYAAHKEFALPIALIMAIIENESSWNPEAVSHKGARGLMQIMPVWDNILRGAGIIDKKEDIFSVSNNIRAGCWIFEGYREDARDFSTSEQLSLDKALDAYSGGGGQEYIAKVRKSMKRIELFMEE